MTTTFEPITVLPYSTPIQQNDILYIVQQNGTSDNIVDIATLFTNSIITTPTINGGTITDTGIDDSSISDPTITGGSIEGTDLIDLASRNPGLGASLVGVQDVGNYFTVKTVEGALQQLAAAIGGGVNVPKDRHVATAGQTIFDLDFAYIPGSNDLNVYVNGLYNDLSAYVETNTTTVTFNIGLLLGDVVNFVKG